MCASIHRTAVWSIVFLVLGILVPKEMWGNSYSAVKRISIFFYTRPDCTMYIVHRAQGMRMCTEPERTMIVWLCETPPSTSDCIHCIDIDFSVIVES